MLKTPLGFFLAMALPPVISPAQTPSAPKPVLVQKVGEVVRWTLSDGREIQLVVNYNEPFSLPLQFSLNETTCERPSSALPKCHLTLPAQIIRYNVLWSQHPDPSKIGEAVKIVENETQIPIEDLHQFLPYHRYQMSPHFDHLSAMHLVCEDFSWLSGTKEAPASYDFISWSGELMFNNPETGAPENMTVGGIFDVHFEASDAQTLTVQSTGAWFAHNQTFLEILAIVGDVFHWVEPSPQGPACQTSVKPNTGALQAAATEYIRRLPNNYVPYVESVDGLWDLRPASNAIKNRLNETTEDKLQ